MKLVIDRFEGDLAVCEAENRAMIKVSKSYLPSEAKEGDVIYFKGIEAQIDVEETVRRKRTAEKLLDDLWDKG